MKKIALTVGVMGALQGILWLLQGLGVMHVRPVFCIGNCDRIQGP